MTVCSPWRADAAGGEGDVMDDDERGKGERIKNKERSGNGTSSEG